MRPKRPQTPKLALVRAPALSKGVNRVNPVNRRVNRVNLIFQDVLLAAPRAAAPRIAFLAGEDPLNICPAVPINGDL
jgi:hypothetical protein